MHQAIVVRKGSSHTIQSALDTIVEGGHITVMGGIHKGPIIIHKPVQLRGLPFRGELPILWTFGGAEAFRIKPKEGVSISGFLCQGMPPTRWRRFRRWLRHHFRMFR